MGRKWSGGLEKWGEASSGHVGRQMDGAEPLGQREEKKGRKRRRRGEGRGQERERNQ